MGGNEKYVWTYNISRGCKVGCRIWGVTKNTSGLRIFLEVVKLDVGSAGQENYLWT